MTSYNLKNFSYLFLSSTILFVLSGCNEKLTGQSQENSPEKPFVQTSSKDFWIDRCDIKYRGENFPITGTVNDVVKLLGPYDRFTEVGNRYFWDAIGLQVATGLEAGTPEDSDAIISAGLLFNHEESSVEMGLRLADRPEDRVRLAEINGSRPQGFFRGELVIEGALIGQEVDFEKINDTRLEYLKTQDGPDAELKPIQQSWSATRYAFERSCADGKHVRFIFNLMSFESGDPKRLETITIASDNAPE